MTATETEYLRLADGRMLAYCQYGDLQGVPLFYAHGGPGSRLEGAIFHEQAAKYGLRLIATDRPGMGQSTYKPDRTLLDYPHDISELADKLGLEKFGVMGWSSGGAYTVVCAYEIAERLLFTVSLCGYTNFVELPGAAELLETSVDRISVALSRRFPRLFQIFFDLFSFGIKHFAGVFYRETIRALSKSDQEIMKDPGFKKHFIADQKEAFHHGSKGSALDASEQYIDWGFRLAEITPKVHIFHGTEDKLVPFAFGQHLAKNIPNSEFHHLEGQGHLFPFNHQQLIFETIRQEI